MLKPLLTAVFGTRHEREMKRVQPIVDEINAEYERLQSVSDEELRAQTAKLRGIIHDRSAELEAKVSELKERKKLTPDAEERTRMEEGLNGPDGRAASRASCTKRSTKCWMRFC